MVYRLHHIYYIYIYISYNINNKLHSRYTHTVCTHGKVMRRGAQTRVPWQRPKRATGSNHAELSLRRFVACKKALSDQKALAKTLSTFARLRFPYFYFLCRLSLFKFTKEKKMFLIPRNPRMNALLCSIDATSALSIVSLWLKNDTAMAYGIARATLTEEPRVTRW